MILITSDLTYQQIPVQSNRSRYRTLAQSKPELTSRAEVKCRIHLPLISAGSEVSVKEVKGDKT